MADNPFAGFVDNGPAAPPSAKAAGPFAGFEDLGPGSKPRMDVSASKAALEGYLDTAGFGFRDEIRGLSEASGLPEWMGGFRAPVGAARLTHEQNPGRIGFGGTYFGGHDKEAPGGISSLVTGDTRGPIEKTYEEARDAARKVQHAAQEQHPEAYLGGQVAGVAVAPGLAATKGATVAARAARSALAGGIQGGIYGAGSAEGDLTDRAIEGAKGAAVGTVAGAIGSPVADVAGVGLQKAGQFVRSTYNTLRAELSPEAGRRIVEDEAAKRVVASHLADRESQGLAWTPEEAQIAQEAGVPRSIVDIGGERSLSLAQSAANQSPEARAALEGLAKDRFAGQTTRAATFIKGLTGGLDEAAEREVLQSQATLSARRAYDLARKQGFKEIWTPELQRLSRAPDVREAILAGGRYEGNESIVGGFARPRKNPFTTDENGNLVFRSLPSGTATSVPDIAFWDGVKKRMQDREGSLLRAGKTQAARQTGILRRGLVDQLDAEVPEYQVARRGSAAFFNAEDALEAGRNYVTQRVNDADAFRALSRMGPPERELFARGFSAEMADRTLELRDNQNVINQAFLTSPAAKQRIAVALGPDRARKLEIYLRTESLTDRLRNALGGSPTARRLAEMGLAGAGTLAIGHGAVEGEWDAKHALTAALLFGAAYGKHRSQVLDNSVARRIGEMLASNDPAILRRGVDIVSKSRKLTESLREAGDRFRDRFAGRGLPTLAAGEVVNNSGQ